MDKYIVVEGSMPNVPSEKTQAERFSEKVNKRIEEGYRPIGGVTIVPGICGHLDFFQAMVLVK